MVPKNARERKDDMENINKENTKENIIKFVKRSKLNFFFFVTIKTKKLLCTISILYFILNHVHIFFYILINYEIKQILNLKKKI